MFLRYKVAFLLLTSLFFIQCSKDDLSNSNTSHSSVRISKADEEIILNQLTKQTADASEFSVRDREFFKGLDIIANNMEGLYEGVDETATYEVRYNQLKANIRARLDMVIEMANVHYNGSVEKVTLAKNAFVLMNYDVITHQYPEFMWTSLGCFAANEVRNGVVLCYLMRDIVKKNNININIDKLTGLDVSNMMMDASQILMEGQLEVLTDIGALALLNKYGPENLMHETWMTQEARNGYAFQYQAQTALANGDNKAFQDLQTAAAIEFGAHEQIYILQKLWDKELMVQFSAINQWLLESSKGKFSVFGDIFIGTNKYTEFMFGRVFKIPKGAVDLTSAIDRVEIARNGFNSLNALRKQAAGSAWIEYSQKRLGNYEGVYRVPGY
jgi:hypothetical protein